MKDPNNITARVECPHCKAEGQHSLSSIRKSGRTIATTVCKNCGYVMGGEIERIGPDTMENLIQDVRRAARNGDLHQIKETDRGVRKPPVKDWPHEES